MVKILVDEDNLLDFFIDRLDHWNLSDWERILYINMYEDQIDNGYYDNSEIDIMDIVDNDAVNNCTAIDYSDERFDEISAHYNNNEYECELEDGDTYYIEAAAGSGPDYFLIRKV